ncbi:hypothetical protein SAMN05661012_00390 [Chitinophaga sancti]|uniref:Uncharacterized protein n=1 Tax=Chitinophaga sancti TaxID=1004 RepID=A0A1K1M2E6_9BACT|nr:hypothetical protein SAMN05661012_00390 [Chitinophaga sancti]
MEEFSMNAAFKKVKLFLKSFELINEKMRITMILSVIIVIRIFNSCPRISYSRCSVYTAPVLYPAVI